MAKAGSSRIPKFGCRIPQPHLFKPRPHVQPSLITPTTSPAVCPLITLKEIGRKVRVADREGILRFVGSVHFAPGVWCGIELSEAFGKHDGFIKGVRYFSCPPNCGKMAPVCEVALVDTDCDSVKEIDIEDGASGPYSILFIDNIRHSDTYVNNSNDNINTRNCTYSLKEVHSLHNKSEYLQCLGDQSHRTSSSTETTFISNISTEIFNKLGRGKYEIKETSVERSFNISSDLNTNNASRYLQETEKPVAQSGFSTPSDKALLVETFNSKQIPPDLCSDTALPKDNCEVLYCKEAPNENFAIDECNGVHGLENRLQECEGKNRRNVFTFDKNIFENGAILSEKEHLNKTNSLPQLRNINRNFASLTFTSPPVSVVSLKFSHSTPAKTESIGSSSCLDDEGNKRDSLDLDESWGILTPEQMVDGMTYIPGSKTPSTEYIRSKVVETEGVSKIEEKNASPSILASSENLVDIRPRYSDNEVKPTDIDVKSELPSPSNVTDYSLGIIDDHLLSNLTLKPDTTINNLESDYSLGIIDEHLLSNLTLKTDTTMNMELPLDTVGKSNSYAMARLDQTPSPEDLPLDPTPIIECDPKTEPTKSKTTNSFITSITSITSLDTGYQGDGEMSRPGSRGADTSPLTRRPLPRPPCRRPDPMTDSDFYTESDADNHEENVLKGDRRAQVIDGTLYGVDPQAAADIYVNNRENMDSSGIFTDLETNSTQTDELQVPNENMDVSPSETSSKTISENSQDNLKNIISKSLSSNVSAKKVDDRIEPKKENAKKRNAPSPSSVGSSPSSVMSPRHVSKEECPVKKYKMPKKDVASKVKAMMEPNIVDKERKIPLKKPAGRWDAVLNKISKTDATRTNFKDVKSKLFSVTVAHGQNEVRSIPRPAVGEKTQNGKLRRVRQRGVPSPKTHSNVGSSIHSSLSDLSGASNKPKTPGSTKKREPVQVTQVLTASKLTPRSPPSNVKENKKPPSSSEPKATKRILFSPKEKKQPTTNKECSRGTVKGGRNSPAVRPPPSPRVPVKNVPRVAEALAVLVQHLVFNVEAYQVPSLRRDVQKFRLEAEEIRLACQHLEETLAQEKLKQVKAIEEERARCQKDVNELVERHRIQINQIIDRNKESEQHLALEHENVCQKLSRQNEEQLLMLKNEFQKLQKTHEESLDILREENDAIREQIDEKNEVIKHCKHESTKLKQDYEAKEHKYTKENQRLKFELDNIEEKFNEKMKIIQEENHKLREENDRLLSYGDDKGISMQEVQSLRAVLELKQNEVADLRRALAEATQKAEALAGAAEKAAALNARCEDLEHQLQRKIEHDQSLIMENKKLQDSFKEEINQKRRLTQYNEELQWKLKQSKEVINKVIEQAEESGFSRSILSASFNERHNSSYKNFERTLSFREGTNSAKINNCLDSPNKSKKSKVLEFDLIDLPSPTSPKVKGIVEKSDSVSYVLDLDEDPNVVASRIFRRSFRNTTPPKNTPTKSPSSTNNKRPRVKNALSLSSSATSLTSDNKEHHRSRSASASSPIAGCNTLEESFESSCSSLIKFDDSIDLDDENDVDLTLPALPSEIGRQHRAQALPSPKHLAGEAMISESNSEDESTSSSSVQL